MDVSIGRCTAGEIDEVVGFIDQHWKRGHILTTCRPLLDWQYRDHDGTGYAFVLARRRSDAALLGILGYVATKRFDPSLIHSNVVWLTTWKVRDDAGVSGLGIRLLQHLASIEPHVAIGAVGLTPSTLPIYKALGYAVGELQHYVCRPATTSAHAGDSFRAERLIADSDLAPIRWSPDSTALPAKTPEYFRQRYARHPVYRYTIDAISDSDAVVGLLAARIAEHNGRRALRVVDFAGLAHSLSRIGPIVRRMLTEFDAEYADIYNAGIDERVFAQAGFSKVDPDGLEIVPDHFEPFEHRNVRLWYAIKGGGTPVLFKADGDQDRPNRLPERTA